MNQEELTNDLVAMANLYMRLSEVVDTYDKDRYENNENYRNGIENCTEFCDKLYDDMISHCRIDWIGK